MLHLPLLLIVAALSAGPVALPAEDAVLQSLKAGHPRLLAGKPDIDRIRLTIRENAAAAKIYDRVKGDAEKMLTAAPIEHKLVGPRLLGESRKCLERVYTLGLVYRIDGDRRFLDRAVKEMLVAAAFKDWNPSHFLDTAEMTHALAVGYDWFYDDLSAADRKTIRTAIVEKGLKQAEAVYRKQERWSQAKHNWNQVCNGGMTIGALAVAEDEPKLSAYIVHQALSSLPRAMAEFAPDGAWGEGPGYWGYATSYTVYLLAALDSALGTDFGLSRSPGFPVTGDFRVHSVGPTLLTFNFADAHSGAGSAPQMFWMSRKFDQPLYAWHEREVIKGHSAQHLLWFDPRGAAPTNLPTDRWFRNADVVTMRGNWTDARTSYCGFKGGDNKVNHSHLELGEFVFDADGQRWALDLGSDDYNLPGYFGKQRWTYYRLGTQGQNTLVVDGKNQDPKAVAPIVAFSAAPKRTSAIADLSAAYAGQLKKALRGIALVDHRQLLVQDELESDAGAKQIVWQMHTEAKIELAGNTAILQLGGEKLTAKILSPVNAKFEVASANPSPPQRQQPNVKKLVVKLAADGKPTCLAVLLAPGVEKTVKAAKLTPLSQWSGWAKGKTAR